MSLNQKTALITGASSGLGLASARALAAKGTNLIMVARGEERLEKAAKDIAQKYPSITVDAKVLDISNLDTLRQFTDSITQPIDVLMNNAGLMGPDFSLSIEGIESQMATNHIGHFLLTALLWPNLNRASDARVISLSSVVHRKGKLKTAGIDEIRGSDPKKYDRWQRYADSKLACLFFARELDIRARLSGSKVKSIAAHPGWALTNLQQGNPTPFDRLAQPSEVGARAQIRAAIEDGFSGGEFIGPKFELWGEPKNIKGSVRSRNLEISRALWATSEDLTGIKFLA
ncbi:MAG: SDR family NAD(P)-dependent oxidoreductase [Aquiluna sp.]|nr:SDR family NAD(P)-dependent oxidoreductase [Aquiluna sp.]MCF8545806.1 SDR family NAD(P)-dependent oxidoreductase [Aquiluna sp.]